MSDVPAHEDAPAPFSVAVLTELTRRGLTVAVAESLTGGLVTAEMTRPPGASSVVVGGVIAYQTPLKAELLHVDDALLEAEGPVHPEVAKQMARGVRRMLAVDGREADVGLATTGVAGPDPQEDKAPGTVFIAVSFEDGERVRELSLSGSRDAIRAHTVSEVMGLLAEVIGVPRLPA